MRQHGQFEIMCALAVTGQLDDQETRDLQEHLQQCADCKNRVVDLARLSAQALLPLAARRERCPIPKGMEARFTTRALAEGILLSSSRYKAKGTGSVRSLNLLGALTAALFLALLIVGAIARQVRSPRQLEAFDSTRPSADQPAAFTPALLKPVLGAKTHVAAIALHDGQAGTDSLRSTDKAGSYRLRVPAQLSVEDAPAFFLIASIRRSEQIGHLSSTAFETSFPKSVQHVFHYDPDAANFSSQPVYSHQSFDWYRWVQRSDRFMGFLNNSSQ